MAVPFHFAPTEPKKKEERHQHFSSIDITLRSDSLDLNRRWQLKAGVYPKQDNSVLMVVLRLTLRKSVLFHRYIVVYCPSHPPASNIAGSPFSGACNCLNYKGSTGLEFLGILTSIG